MAIRGVGSVFGERQSGDVTQVGIDLYLEMLYQQLSGVEACRLPAVAWGAVELSLGCVEGVPLDLGSPQQRAALAAAAAAAGAEGPAALRELKAQLEEQLSGPLPKQLHRLLRCHLLRWLASQLGVHRIELGPPGRIHMLSAMRRDAFDIMELRLPAGDRAALSYEGSGPAGGMVVLKQAVAVQDVPIWQALGDMHCERCINHLTQLLEAMPKFLKFV